MAGAEVAEQDLGVTVDDSKQIVEVVSDSAGEAADCFHFLGLAELVFEDAAFGDVLSYGFEDVGGFVAAGDGASADADGDGRAVFALPADFESVHASGTTEFVDQAVVFGGIDEDVFLRIEGQDIDCRVVAEHSDEGGVDVEKVAFEAGAVDAVDGGLYQGAIANFRAAQSLLVAFAVDRGSQLLGDQGENFFIALAEADAFGITFDHEHAEEVIVDLERNAQPIVGTRAGEHDCAAFHQLAEEFWRAEQRFAGAKDVFDETRSGFLGWGSGFAFVHEVREAEQLRFGILKGDGEIAGAEKFVNDAVDGGEELLQVLCGAGLFGNAIESGAERFGALARGDVAIQDIESGSTAADDQGSGGD